MFKWEKAEVKSWTYWVSPVSAIWMRSRTFIRIGPENAYMKIDDEWFGLTLSERSRGVAESPERLRRLSPIETA